MRRQPAQPSSAATLCTARRHLTTQIPAQQCLPRHCRSQRWQHQQIRAPPVRNNIATISNNNLLYTNTIHTQTRPILPSLIICSLSHITHYIHYYTQYRILATKTTTKKKIIKKKTNILLKTLHKEKHTHTYTIHKRKITAADCSIKFSSIISRKYYN